MSSQTLTFILLLSPLVIGAIIALVNGDGLNNATERAEAWARGKHAKSAGKGSWFNRYIITPLLWAMVQFSNWTDSFKHRGVKNGVRVALSLYSIIFWCVIIYNIIKALIIIAAMLLIVYVLLKMLFSSNSDGEPTYNPEPNYKPKPEPRVLGLAKQGQMVDQKTGEILENSVFGWQKSGKTINPKTGKIEKGIFDLGLTVDQKTGIIREKGYFGDLETFTQINLETGIIQKHTALDWIETDERIDPETGIHQTRGPFGWQND